MKPSLLVLAAGIGSRYGGLKQIDPVGPSGEIIIDYSIYDAIRSGFGKIVFLIRKDIEETFRECISKKYENSIDIDYAFQELHMLPQGFSVPAERKKPWGTGHAIICAEKSIKEPFAAINADDFYGREGYRLLAERLSSVADGKTSEFCMVGFQLENTLSDFGSVARGVCVAGKDDYLISVTERTNIEKSGTGAVFTDESGSVHELTGKETVSMNMWGFTPSIFTGLKEQFVHFLKKRMDNPKSEFFIPNAVAEMIDRKQARVKVLRSSDPWFGITYKEDKTMVVESIRALVRNGIYPEKLFK